MRGLPRHRTGACRAGQSPSSGDDILGGAPIEIWKDGECTHSLYKPYCTAARAEDLNDAVQRAHEELGESVGDENGRIRVHVTENALQHPSHLADYDPMGDVIRIRKTGSEVRDDGVDAAPHEMGHAFVDKHHPGADSSNLEHWGVDEGFAKILSEKTRAQTSHPEPTGGSVAEIRDNWRKKKAAGETVHSFQIAHDIGNLLVKVYNEVATSTDEETAFRVFRDAVGDEDFDHLGIDGENVTFEEMLLNVLQEAAKIEDEEEAQEATEAIAEAFRDVADVAFSLPAIHQPDDILPDVAGWLPVPVLPRWSIDRRRFNCFISAVRSTAICIRRNSEEPRGD